VLRQKCEDRSASDLHCYTVGMSQPASDTIDNQPRPALSVIDATSIIVGIIIGSGIYQSSPDIATGAGRWAVEWFGSGKASAETQEWIGVAAVISVWLLGGLIALVGAMCYAELATAFPRTGGTYAFLTEAFGSGMGFAFAWAEFWIVRPGNVGAISFIMARYARQLVAPDSQHAIWIELAIAAAAILVIAALNASGLRSGKWTQNVLTAAKLAGLAAVALVAFSLPASTAHQPLPTEPWKTMATALIMVMFAYGGWADMSFVAAEVRDPARNISRALLLGTLIVTGTYVVITLAFLHALGVGGLANSRAVAAEVLALRFGSLGANAISLLVVISCLGAINGTLFTGARVYYALGTEHPVFRWLGRWNERTGVPLRSLLAQTVVTLGLVIGFGLYAEGFERLVIFTGPFYWGFIGLVGIALMVLRARGGTATAAYRVPLYPLTPIIFAGSSAAMVYAAIAFAVQKRSPEAFWAVGVVLAGIVVGVIDARARRMKNRRPS
jgi:basic amino acid/polyamine antiporter, APA family